MANAGLLAHVSPDDEMIPTRVTGTLDGGPPTGLRDVAVAVDGRVWATGRSFRLRGRPCEYFSLLVPEESLRPGPQPDRAVRGGPGRPAGAAVPRLVHGPVRQLRSGPCTTSTGRLLASMKQHQKRRRSSCAMQVRK